MDAVASLPAILGVAFVAAASPGPATLAITTTAMARGVRPAMGLAAGVMLGSLIWSVSAAAGLGALMLAQGWIVEGIRYAGAAYLIWLGIKSLRAAWRGGTSKGIVPERRAFMRGLLIHLTNPKAIFFFGALYAVVLSPGQGIAALATVVIAIAAQSAVIFFGYAVLFSRPGPTRVYHRFSRWINGMAGLAFGAIGLRLLTARLV